MKKRNIVAILILLFLHSYRADSQSCDPPLPPVLKSVSVQPETGYTDFTWTLSPSTDVAAYLIYTYHNENGIPRGDIIDTIWDPAATSYTYKSTISSYFSVSYVVAAFRRPKCTSSFSNVINTIFTEASVDTCNKKIIIKWNSYPSIPEKVTGYTVMVGVNGGSYSVAGRVSSAVNTFELNNFLNDARYCFVVKGDLENGTFSSSNKFCLQTKMQRPPDWINADYATVDQNNNLYVSFSIDPLSQISSYWLERKTVKDPDFTTISKIESKSSNVTYTDKTADPLIINYYRLVAVNSCGIPVVSSNLSCNIVPVVNKNGDMLQLSWNRYRYWMGSVSGYRVFIDEGSGFHEYSSVSPGDSLLLINYTSVMYYITGNSLCFYIEADETANPHAINGKTVSAKMCIEATENVTVPNAFTPNNDLLNDFFKPVLSFAPLEYHLVITDRNNNIMFDSRDYLAEWNGKKNNESLPHGVYLWFLNIKTPSGKRITRTGTVTILNQP
jgi:gliding motility-associated-like protein